MTFRDLLPGQRFMFVDARGFDMPRREKVGPWEKVGLGKYIHAGHGYAIGWGAYLTSPHARVRVTNEGEGS